MRRIVFMNERGSELKKKEGTPKRKGNFIKSGVVWLPHLITPTVFISKEDPRIGPRKQSWYAMMHFLNDDIDYKMKKYICKSSMKPNI